MATSILLVDSVSSGLMKPTAMLVRSTAKMRMASGKQQEMKALRSKPLEELNPTNNLMNIMWQQIPPQSGLQRRPQHDHLCDWDR